MFKSLFGFFNGQSVGKIFDDEIKVVYQDQMLSQAELQLLQGIVAAEIRFEHIQKEYLKETALKYASQISVRNLYFKQHRKSKAKLKKLSALQYRLKHKITAKE